MTFLPSSSDRRWWWISGLIGTIVLIALVPWWRNHGFLTDFYDYGLVMSGVGRIAAGERLYVDIISPIQGGIFLLNGAAQKLGGGGFQAMTLGGACLIVFTSVAVCLILSRRWPLLAVIGVAAGIVFGSVVQHTIVWHNTTGVVCLALVVWGAALAPVLRRSTWPWHVLVIVGLWLGGMNKLNFQIVALAVACGWTLRAGLTGGESRGRTALTLVGWVTAGTVLPVLTEIAWTGATFAEWWYNVVQLPFASRAGTLSQILTWKFHLFSPHIYYGPLVLPQIGLVSMGLLLLTVVAGLRQGSSKGWADRLLLIIAAVLALGAGSALHATNFDIGYVSLSATVVLAVGLWLGFGLAPRGFLFWGGLVVPSLLMGTVAWESAWRGQRSQFGHTSASRKNFLAAETADPAFVYLRGTRLPPEIHESLGGAARWLHSVKQGGLHPVFYGPGAEWLEAVFPAVKPGPMPLLAQWGATYGPRELSRLHAALRGGGAYAAVLSVHAWDVWTPETLRLLDFYYRKTQIGGGIDLRERTETPPALAAALSFRNQFGGSTAATVLNFRHTPIEPLSDTAKVGFLGVTRGEGRIALSAPVWRVAGEAVVVRSEASDNRPVFADFRVIGQRTGSVRWNGRLELPAGQKEARISFLVDMYGEPLEQVVTVPAPFQDQVGAGFSNPRINSVGPDDGPAPHLWPIPSPDVPVNQLEKFLPDGWRPEKITLRNGRVTPEGAELQVGGELWLRPPGSLTGLTYQVVLAPGASGSGLPFVRIVWYKSGRLEIMRQEAVPVGGTLNFRAWSAEPDGWFGILVDPSPGAIPATVRILQAEPAP